MAGNVHVSGEWSERIRRIDPSGVISTYAGGGDELWSRDGQRAIEVRMRPFGVATDAAGNLYAAEKWEGRVSKID